MPQIIKALAILGAVWAVCLAILLVLISLWAGNFSPMALVVPGALLFVFQRLYRLKRWALAATCLYCVWMVLGSFGSGIWQWTLGWFLVASLTITLLEGNWNRLEPGL